MCTVSLTPDDDGDDVGDEERIEFVSHNLELEPLPNPDTTIHNIEEERLNGRGQVGVET